MNGTIDGFLLTVINFLRNFNLFRRAPSRLYFPALNPIAAVNIAPTRPPLIILDSLKATKVLNKWKCTLYWDPHFKQHAIKQAPFSPWASHEEPFSS